MILPVGSLGTPRLTDWDDLCTEFTDVFELPVNTTRVIKLSTRSNCCQIVPHQVNNNI